jgi:hypothetical protein
MKSVLSAISVVQQLWQVRLDWRRWLAQTPNARANASGCSGWQNQWQSPNHSSCANTHSQLMMLGYSGSRWVLTFELVRLDALMVTLNVVSVWC